MSLPLEYQWLSKEGAPKMLVAALELYGTKEILGDGNNPEILEWAKETGLQDVYKEDSTAWCGLFIAVVAKRAGKEVVKDPLWAANWLKFGTKASEAMLGDVLVFKRPGGSHVGLYCGEDKNTYHVLGGNQSDKVCITRILKERCRGARRPIFKTGQPANVRKIILSTSGIISENES
jgi:uncharacterized protein (TIGR02594 family)